jgi:hypothetical protein
LVGIRGGSRGHRCRSTPWRITQDAKTCRHTTADKLRCTATVLVLVCSERAGQVPNPLRVTQGSPSPVDRADRSPVRRSRGSGTCRVPAPGPDTPCSNTTLLAFVGISPGQRSLWRDRVPTICGTPARRMVWISAGVGWSRRARRSLVAMRTRRSLACMSAVEGGQVGQLRVQPVGTCHCHEGGRGGPADRDHY